MKNKYFTLYNKLLEEQEEALKWLDLSAIQTPILLLGDNESNKIFSECFGKNELLEERNKSFKYPVRFIRDNLTFIAFPAFGDSDNLFQSVFNSHIIQKIKQFKIIIVVSENDFAGKLVNFKEQLLLVDRLFGNNLSPENFMFVISDSTSQDYSALASFLEVEVLSKIFKSGENLGAKKFIESVIMQARNEKVIFLKNEEKRLVEEDENKIIKLIEELETIDKAEFALSDRSQSKIMELVDNVIDNISKKLEDIKYVTKDPRKENLKIIKDELINLQDKDIELLQNFLIKYEILNGNEEDISFLVKIFDGIPNEAINIKINNFVSATIVTIDNLVSSMLLSLSTDEIKEKEQLLIDLQPNQNKYNSPDLPQIHFVLEEENDTKTEEPCEIKEQKILKESTTIQWLLFNSIATIKWLLLKPFYWFSFPHKSPDLNSNQVFEKSLKNYIEGIINITTKVVDNAFSKVPDKFLLKEVVKDILSFKLLREQVDIKESEHLIEMLSNIETFKNLALENNESIKITFFESMNKEIYDIITGNVEIKTSGDWEIVDE